MVLRLEELLFPSTADVSVLAVGVKNETVRIEARSTAGGSACPGCGSWSTRVHSSYLRFPADVPSTGLRVLLRLRVRRFICRFASCGRRTFVEQVPGLTRRYSRWTERLRSTLAAVGLALAGRAGARMASVFGVSVSRSTVLGAPTVATRAGPGARRTHGYSWLPVAYRPPVRRSDTSQSRRRSRAAGRRPKPPRDPTPARHDLPHRQAPR
ncbi:transposase family protein [Streptomyces sioyaensis]|uniref:transposase family protein n=1 Tax=Streptomyces sioyaensis TaxID=67364 RepID=UPI003656D4E4